MYLFYALFTTCLVALVTVSTLAHTEIDRYRHLLLNCPTLSPLQLRGWDSFFIVLQNLENQQKKNAITLTERKKNIDFQVF
jgi:hypothetical protein